MVLAPEQKNQTQIKRQCTNRDPASGMAGPMLSHPREGRGQHGDEYEQPEDHTAYIAKRPSNTRVPTAMVAAYQRTRPV